MMVIAVTVSKRERRHQKSVRAVITKRHIKITKAYLFLSRRRLMEEEREIATTTAADGRVERAATADDGGSSDCGQW